MRRLPVYLLIDVSGSMTGEPIESVKNGIQLLLSTLRKDPQALESAFLSVITFSDRVTQVVPLTEVATVQLPNITASGGTSLGQALQTLTETANKEINKGTSSEKGDWKPLVFLMTDGQPTDSVERGLQAFKEGKWGIVVACAAGSGADTNLLRRITENVVVLDTCDSNSIKAFFMWVSSSVSASSKRVDSGAQPDTLNELPPPPEEISLLKF
ncbi:MAG: VWA domain-containing protein [Deltaproteobacteria bacterium]|jgi:uncharacterized protein YegL|nr:VWA domain-containing protein [Deltaproteobacteria bacterium]